MSKIQIEADLRSRFGPVRDQGARPTCLAFAASDCHAGMRKEWRPLSCEYAFYNAQCRAGQPPNRGARLKPMLDTLLIDGQPEEGGWPYLDKTPEDITKWFPPRSVGELYRRGGNSILSTVDQVVAEVNNGKPVIALIKLCSAFFNANASTKFIGAEVAAIPVSPARHAVVVIGHGTFNCDRVLLIRNSWGTGWGNGGYAWLSEGYLSPRMFSASVLTEDKNEFQNTAIS